MRYFCSMNYYELFGFPVGFTIDPVKLNQTYISLQKKYHPDYFGQSSPEDQSQALELSSQVNKAYRTFKNKDLTLQYFLQMKGLTEEGEAYKLPPEFLMEVMDLNELKMDGAEPEEIKRKAEQLEEEIFGEIKLLLENYLDEEATTEDLIKIKDYYYKKKYIDRLLAE
jgi:molecular chaperone HscB